MPEQDQTVLAMRKIGGTRGIETGDLRLRAFTAVL